MNKKFSCVKHSKSFLKRQMCIAPFSEWNSSTSSMLEIQSEKACSVLNEWKNKFPSNH